MNTIGHNKYPISLYMFSFLACLFYLCISARCEGCCVGMVCLSVCYRNKKGAVFSQNSVFFFLMKETNAKMSLHILQAFCRSQPSVNWVCFTGGTVAPPGHQSLIDEAHMWAPYASWQGQRGAVTSWWPMNWDASAQRPDCCQDIQGGDRQHQNPSRWWCQAEMIDGLRH